eukprot:COSAG06_NODE_65_length_26676_cov_11.671107_20_plen_98_part_00
MDASALSKAASLASLVAMVQDRSYKISKQQVTRAMDASNPAQAIAELLLPKLRELAEQFAAADANSVLGCEVVRTFSTNFVRMGPGELVFKALYTMS